MYIDGYMIFAYLIILIVCIELYYSCINATFENRDENREE
jgi:hypothetical protein